MYGRRNTKPLSLQSLLLPPLPPSPSSVFLSTFTPSPPDFPEVFPLCVCTSLRQSITLCHSPGEARIIGCQRNDILLVFFKSVNYRCCTVNDSINERIRITFCSRKWDKCGEKAKETWHWSNVNQLLGSVKLNGTSGPHEVCYLLYRGRNLSSGGSYFPSCV